jgi:formate/nitrite transporter FocA (FNT family)
MSLNLLIKLQVNVEEKIKTAPNNAYAIGVWIGNILPFVILVGLAYWMYSKAKNRRLDE